MAYQTYGKIFDKYNAFEMGKRGTGSEIIESQGFGWTNGVVLSFLDKYGPILHAP